MTKGGFETQVIFGALCEGAPASPRSLARMLKARIKNAALLPFQVEKRHLKNVVACMRLMDVMGLVVVGRHRAGIAAHLTKLHASAAAAGEVDTVVRRGKSFVGFSARGIALSEWLKKVNTKRSGASRPAAQRLTKRAREIAVGLLTEGLAAK